MAVTALSLADTFDATVPRHQSLQLVPVSGDLPGLRRALVDALRPPWSDPGVDDGAEQERPELWTWFQLERHAQGSEAGVRAVLHRRDAAGTFELTNLVPVGRGAGRLDRDRYNRFVREFRDTVVRPLERDGVVRARLSDDTEPFADWVGEDAVQALARFSLAANRSNAASHPDDADRWNAFLVEALPARRSGLAGALEQVLVRNGWSEDIAVELAEAAEHVADYEDKRRERVASVSAPSSIDS